MSVKIKGYTRKSASGKIVRVKEYTRDGDKSESKTKMSHGKKDPRFEISRGESDIMSAAEKSAQTAIDIAAMKEHISNLSKANAAMGVTDRNSSPSYENQKKEWGKVNAKLKEKAAKIKAEDAVNGNEKPAANRKRRKNDFAQRLEDKIASLSGKQYKRVL